jgi:hypothetical protein
MKTLIILLFLFALPRPAITGLLGIGSPSAVLGAVVPVIIDPVNFTPIKITRVHISDEILKNMPSFANRNTTGTITIKPFIFRTVATMVERSPSTIQGMFPSAVLSHGCQLAASATSYTTVDERIDSSEMRKFTANTLANGHITIRSNSLSNNLDSQSTKRLTYFETSSGKWLKTEFSQVHDINQFGMTG